VKVNPNDLVIGGWDISKMNLGEAMKRSKVLDVQLQDKLYDDMKEFIPMPSIYYPDFIAANQAERADNVLKGSKQENLEQIMKDINDFKAKNDWIKLLFYGQLIRNDSVKSKKELMILQIIF